MNPFVVEVKACTVQGDGTEWVSEAELTQAISLTSLEQAVRNRSADIIRKARKQRDMSRVHAKHVLLQAQEEAEAMKGKWQKEAKEEAMSQVLEWHFDEVQWTHAVMDNLHASISEKIKHVLTAWTLDQELSPFMIKRLSDQVCERVGMNTVSLMVSTDDYEAMAGAFAGRMNVEASPNLLSGQAELSSATLTARVDLAEELECLLETFIGQPAVKNVGT